MCICISANEAGAAGLASDSTLIILSHVLHCLQPYGHAASSLEVIEPPSYEMFRLSTKTAKVRYFSSKSSVRVDYDHCRIGSIELLFKRRFDIDAVE